MALSLNIREAQLADWDRIWPFFSDIVRAGDSYSYSPDMSKEEGFQQWMVMPQFTYVAEQSGEVVATYYIKPNQASLGAHVSNCGYMVSPSYRGGGIASQLCVHSQSIAIKLGYKAMQFNLVVASNSAAVHLWNKLGFETVGRLLKAFDHQKLGFVDALVMYKWLQD